MSRIGSRGLATTSNAPTGSTRIRSVTDGASTASITARSDGATSPSPCPFDENGVRASEDEEENTNPGDMKEGTGIDKGLNTAADVTSPEDHAITTDKMLQLAEQPTSQPKDQTPTKCQSSSSQKQVEYRYIATKVMGNRSTDTSPKEGAKDTKDKPS